MLGFVNGLAIVIFLAQLGQFKVLDTSGVSVWMEGSALYIMGALIVFTMLIMHFLPKVTTAVPAGLVAIVAVTLIAIGFNLDARNVLDFVRDMLPAEQAATATLKGELPSFAIPAVPITLESIMDYFALCCNYCRNRTDRIIIDLNID